MAARQYPPVELVRQCLRYDDGRLFWLPRPREHFSTHWTHLGWNTKYAGKEAGYLRKGRNGHPTWKVTLNDFKMHRHLIVWAMHHGEWLLGIDHKNRNSLDDRIENLRPATQSQNLANGSFRRNNTSGYKGVFWHKDVRKWAAGIKVNYRFIHLGLFDDPAVAHAAYCEAAKHYFGEFAHDGRPESAG
jgi:hypothetical protein